MAPALHTPPTGHADGTHCSQSELHPSRALWSLSRACSDLGSSLTLPGSQKRSAGDAVNRMGLLRSSGSSSSHREAFDCYHSGRALDVPIAQVPVSCTRHLRGFAIHQLHSCLEDVDRLISSLLESTSRHPWSR